MWLGLVVPCFGGCGLDQHHHMSSAKHLRLLNCRLLSSPSWSKESVRAVQRWQPDTVIDVLRASYPGLRWDLVPAALDYEGFEVRLLLQPCKLPACTACQAPHCIQNQLSPEARPCVWPSHTACTYTVCLAAAPGDFDPLPVALPLPTTWWWRAPAGGCAKPTA